MENKRSYPTDLTDREWELVEAYVRPKSGGRPVTHSRRKILDAIFYIVRGGCAWRLLPKDFAPYQTVYDYYRQWTHSDLWQRINSALRQGLRAKSQRTPTPTAAILDSQSVKAGNQAGERGVDAGKKINGRKRHLLVDTLGLLLAVLVPPANVRWLVSVLTLCALSPRVFIFFQ